MVFLCMTVDPLPISNVLFVLYSASYIIYVLVVFFFFKQKTEYERRISDWSSDVCSSDLRAHRPGTRGGRHPRRRRRRPSSRSLNRRQNPYLSPTPSRTSSKHPKPRPWATTASSWPAPTWNSATSTPREGCCRKWPTMATRPRVARPCGCCASWSDAVGGSGALRTRRRVRRHRPVRLAAAGQAGHQGGADRAAEAGRSAVLGRR